MSGFKHSCFCPRLGQETLVCRSIRGGEKTVLNNISDNTVLTICHFSFCFPFYFSRPDMKGFFSGPNFLLYPLPLLAPGSEHQVFYCSSLWTVCLYTISTCVCVLGCWYSLIKHWKCSHFWLAEVFTDRGLLFQPKDINNQWESIVLINSQR